jgi:hypothetical protein
LWDDATNNRGLQIARIIVKGGAARWDESLISTDRGKSDFAAMEVEEAESTLNQALQLAPEADAITFYLALIYLEPKGYGLVWLVAKTTTRNLRR